MLQPSQHLQV
jgi:hypothetical protein